jgi:hypothetical protein
MCFKELCLQSHLGHQGAKAPVIFISDTLLAPSGAVCWWRFVLVDLKSQNSNHNAITNRSAESAARPKIPFNGPPLPVFN